MSICGKGCHSSLRTFSLPSTKAGDKDSHTYLPILKADKNYQ